MVKSHVLTLQHGQFVGVPSDKLYFSDRCKVPSASFLCGWYLCEDWMPNT